jgi:hypothetical protein
MIKFQFEESLVRSNTPNRFTIELESYTLQ